MYLLSLPLLFSAPSALSLLFLASLFSFGKEVGGNNDWKTSFRPHAGSAGEEERDGDCLLQQHLCHSFCTSQRRKTRPGSERGGDGRGSPIPKGISSINQVSASRLIKSFRMTNSPLFKTSNGWKRTAWLLLARTTKGEVDTLHFCIKLLSQKHERGSVFKQNWPSPMALAACRPWKGRLLSGGDSHFLNTISILRREERWANRIAYATGTFSFVEVKTFRSNWRSFRFSHLNISIIRQQKPSWIWLLSSKEDEERHGPFLSLSSFLVHIRSKIFHCSRGKKQKGRNLYLSACTVCVPLITEVESNGTEKAICLMQSGLVFHSPVLLLQHRRTEETCWVNRPDLIGVSFYKPPNSFKTVSHRQRCGR